MNQLHLKQKIKKKTFNFTLLDSSGLVLTEADPLYIFNVLFSLFNCHIVCCLIHIMAIMNKICVRIREINNVIY